MKASVGPQAEYSNSEISRQIAYGERVTVSARRHTNPDQFAKAVKISSPTEDNGWIGPLGQYSDVTSGGSLYGYGVSPDYPQY